MPETSSETQSAECDACGHRLLKRVLTARDYRTGAGGVFDVWRCRSCGLASIQPRPNWLELQPHYPDWLWEDEIVATSALRERKQASFDRRFRHTISALDKVHAPGRLLDVGCATGEFMATAAARGWSVEGLEVPGRQVDVARARGFSVIATGDFPRQSFEHRYDAITFNHVLEHVPSPRAYLAKALSLLPPGGVMLVSVPNFASFSRRTFGQYWVHLDLPRHLFHFSPPSLRRLFEALNCEVLGVSYADREQNAFGLRSSALKWLKYGAMRRSLPTPGALRGSAGSAESGAKALLRRASEAAALITEWTRLADTFTMIARLR